MENGKQREREGGVIHMENFRKWMIENFPYVKYKIDKEVSTSQKVQVEIITGKCSRKFTLCIEDNDMRKPCNKDFIRFATKIPRLQRKS